MTILPYITEGLRFAPDDSICQPKDNSGEFSCNYNGEGPAMAIHTWKGRNLCAYHSPFDNKYVPCCLCGIKPALRDENPEVDPVCEDCGKDLDAQAAQAPKTCPGWGTGEDCGNDVLPDGDLCGDCHGARLDYESPYPGNPRRYPN